MRVHRSSDSTRDGVGQILLGSFPLTVVGDLLCLPRLLLVALDCNLLYVSHAVLPSCQEQRHSGAQLLGRFRRSHSLGVSYAVPIFDGLCRAALLPLLCHCHYFDELLMGGFRGIPLLRHSFPSVLTVPALASTRSPSK